MKHCIWLATALMLLASEAYGFSYSASTDDIGCSATFSVPTEEGLVASTALDGSSLSNTISGRGDLHENHFVQNGEGATALVRADVRNASSYTYSYQLDPSPAAAKNAQVVQASESLDVQRADYIMAVALAAAPGLYSTASTKVIDGSLNGYSNKAVASTGRAAASQSLNEASGNIKTYSSSDYIEDGAQQRSHVATSVQGDLTGYSNLALSKKATIASFGGSEVILSGAGSEITEDSHIVGSFTSDATAGDKTKIRRSDCGTEFDLNRIARLGGGSGLVRGITSDSQGYYVHSGDKIQDAVNMAQSGDTINVASGTYLENVVVGKSLKIIGAGSQEGSGLHPTIVDGHKSGSVFEIGANYQNVVVTLSNMRIVNGKAWDGGGIYNYGSLTVKSCSIVGNEADEYGGGIYNTGTATVVDCTISDNMARLNGGGIGHNAYWYSDALYIKGDTNIKNNQATYGWGGGICYGDSYLVLDGKEIDITHNKAHLPVPQYEGKWYEGYGVYSSNPDTKNGFDHDDQVKDNSWI